jgi:undecaprenyl diphosphate synthase
MTDNNKTLNHLGLIPDGSRRWAKKENKSYLEAYIQAMDLLYSFIDYSFSKNIPIQSVYALSKENLKRSTSDLEAVFKAEIYFFSELIPKLTEKWKCQVSHAGDSSILPLEYKGALEKTCRASKDNLHNSGKKLYILAGYSPWDEIKVALQADKSSEKMRDNFWVQEDVDLIIRTGYGKLISNFLPLQSSYAELAFIPKLFNDMTIADLRETIEGYIKGEERLLGK